MLESSGADYILWPHYRGKGREKLRQLLETGRWRPLYTDAVSWMVTRADRVAQPSLQPAPPGPWRDLALATISSWAGDDAEAIRRANAARAVLPWQRDACNLLVGVYEKQGDPERANDIREDCRSYFPSTLLR